MATSSITKQFVIKEKRAIDKLIELENKEVHDAKEYVNRSRCSNQYSGRNEKCNGSSSGVVGKCGEA